MKGKKRDEKRSDSVCSLSLCLGKTTTRRDFFGNQATAVSLNGGQRALIADPDPELFNIAFLECFHQVLQQTLERGLSRIQEDDGTSCKGFFNECINVTCEHLPTGSHNRLNMCSIGSSETQSTSCFRLRKSISRQHNQMQSPFGSRTRLLIQLDCLCNQFRAANDAFFLFFN